MKNILTTFQVKAFQLIFYLYNLKNINKKKILIFTDSRGFEITKKRNKRNPFSSYIYLLSKSFRCSAIVCPKKHTSLIDFIEYIENKKLKKYEYIILHCGIVDFAPRPKSSYFDMKQAKIKFLKKKGWLHYFSEIEANPGLEYEGEPTFQFFSERFLLEEVMPIIEKNNNIIYISTNCVIPNWRGTYWKERPSNINDQMQLDLIVRNRTRNVIDLSIWNKEEIKEFTVDNIHLNKNGFNYIYEEISRLIH